MLSVLTEVVNVIPFLRFISQKSPESVSIHRNRTPSLTHPTEHARLTYTWNSSLNFVGVDAKPVHVTGIFLVLSFVTTLIPGVSSHTHKNTHLLSPFWTTSCPCAVVTCPVTMVHRLPKFRAGPMSVSSKLPESIRLLSRPRSWRTRNAP